MSQICPAILASTGEDYSVEINKVAGFAHRLQIDLTDGKFANPPTIKPDEAWWPVGIKADIHLMYQDPLPAVQQLLKHSPHLIIVQAEAGGDFSLFAKACKTHNVKVGVALLVDSRPERISGAMAEIDHVLIFSGSLGRYGGHADLSLLEKVKQLRSMKPQLEIGWDGGISSQNISQLAFGGVDVFNVGGFIQEAPNPEQAYKTLERIASETGTT